LRSLQKKKRRRPRPELGCGAGGGERYDSCGPSLSA